MATIPVNIESTVQSYLARVRKAVPVERAFLFGSHAKGTGHADSDIDIAIVSSAFATLPHLDSFLLLMREARPMNADIQPLPFAPEDLEKPEGILKEILSTGIELTSEGPA